MNTFANQPLSYRSAAWVLPLAVLWALLLGGCDRGSEARAVQGKPANGLGNVDKAASARRETPKPPPGDLPGLSSSAGAFRTGTFSASTDPAPGSLLLLGESIPPGASRRLVWSASRIFDGGTETPVLVVNGREPGPSVCLTAAVHGDELNGIEMVRRVMHDLNPDELEGAVIGVPIVNMLGFRRGSRYLPDRRDLNRYFPGNPDGSSASRIAGSLFEDIITQCDVLVDLHTGSFYRTNLPQLRADLRDPGVVKLSEGFTSMVVLHSPPAPGTLRGAATAIGIPAVTLEAGEPMRVQTAKVSQGVDGILNLLDSMEMIRRVGFLRPTEPVFYQSTWVRADHGGILFSLVRLGQSVETGDVLGTITDPITNEQNLVYSPADGQILGMALNQVVMPGFASFRIGLRAEGLPDEDRMARIDMPGDDDGDQRADGYADHDGDDASE